MGWSRLVLVAGLVGSMGCSDTSGDGGEASIGCVPGMDGELCFGSAARQGCDAMLGTWEVLEVCEPGTSCVQVGATTVCHWDDPATTEAPDVMGSEPDDASGSTGTDGDRTGSDTGPGGDTGGCTVLAGQCPNICDGGEVLHGEICSSAALCVCGLVCVDGSCLPGEGLQPDYEGCTCETGPPPGSSCETSESCADGLVCVSFICVAPPPDDPSDCDKAPPEGAQCNPYCQTGCEDGEHCTYTSGIQCAAFGDLGISETCAASQQCAPGLACIALNQDDLGPICRQFCVDDAQCPGDRNCTMTIVFEAGLSATFCSEPVTSCDPFQEDLACAPGQACYYSSQAGGTQCLGSGTLGEGTVCWGQGAGVCLPGLHCLVTCANVCSVDGAVGVEPCASCPSGEHQVIHEEAGMGVCLSTEVPAACDLFTQDCPAGQKCTTVIGGIACTGDGAVPMGEPCSALAGCVAGGLCVNGGCLQVCDISPDPVPGYACQTVCSDYALLTPAIWGIGVCLAP